MLFLFGKLFEKKPPSPPPETKKQKPPEIKKEEKVLEMKKEGREEKKELSPKEIEETIEAYKEEFRRIQDTIIKIIKNENEPARFRYEDYLEEGSKLEELRNKVEEFLENTENTLENIEDRKTAEELEEKLIKFKIEFKDEYRVFETECNFLCDKYIHSEINEENKFFEATPEEQKKYPEELKARYNIERKAHNYLSYEGKIRKEIEEGKLTKEEIEMLEEELKKTKAAISKEYADLRNKEKEEKEEERKKKLEELRAKLSALRGSEEKKE